MRPFTNTNLGGNHEVNGPQPVIHFWRPPGRNVGVLMRLKKFLWNVGFPGKELVAFPGQKVRLWYLAIAPDPDIAEVPQKAVAFHLAEPVTGGVTLDACCPGVLLDGEEPVPANEVEAQRCRLGERERQRRHVV